MYQCAQFVSNPKLSHSQAVKRIGRYLLATHDKGFVIRPDPNRSYDFYVDASFAGEWIKDRIDQVITDPNTARSRTGYIIFYSGVPITWGSKLQVEICLRSTKAEMLALSAATRDNIHLLRVMADAAHHNVMMDTSNATSHCTIHEDNTGTVIISRERRIHP